MAAAVGVQPSGIAALSRAVVSAAADLVVTVERAVVGDANIRTARDNAWDAICADQARAQARDEIDALVRTLLANRRAALQPVEPQPVAQPQRPNRLALADESRRTVADPRHSRTAGLVSAGTSGR